MSNNKPVLSPLAEPVAVGAAGYQLFREQWPDGNVRFFAQVGRPYENKSSGRTGILGKMYLGSVSDFIRAAKEAEEKLETIKTSQKTDVVSEANALELVENKAA